MRFLFIFRDYHILGAFILGTGAATQLSGLPGFLPYVLLSLFIVWPFVSAAFWGLPREGADVRGSSAESAKNALLNELRPFGDIPVGANGQPLKPAPELRGIFDEETAAPATVHFMTNIPELFGEAYDVEKAARTPVSVVWRDKQTPGSKDTFYMSLLDLINWINSEVGGVLQGRDTVLTHRGHLQYTPNRQFTFDDRFVWRVQFDQEGWDQAHAESPNADAVYTFEPDWAKMEQVLKRG